MKLFYNSTGTGPPLIILHGVFGSADNWITMARRLGEFRTVYLVDQRNHGRSPHAEAFDYEVMAADLHEFITEHQLDKPDILGHSMGGKVAMNFAVQHPELLSKLVVIDIAPKDYPVRHDRILDGLQALDLSKITTRQQADEELAVYIDNPGIRQFLLKNLKRTAEGFTWKMNLKVIHDKIEDIGKGLAPEDRFAGKTLFIRGSESSYVLDEDIPAIRQQFPAARIVTIKGAGHWVHAEKPDELFEALKFFLLAP